MELACGKCLNVLVKREHIKKNCPQWIEDMKARKGEYEERKREEREVQVETQEEPGVMEVRETEVSTEFENPKHDMSEERDEQKEIGETRQRQERKR